LGSLIVMIIFRVYYFYIFEYQAFSSWFSKLWKFSTTSFL